MSVGDVIAVAAVVVGAMGSIVVPLGLRIASWMGTISHTLTDIRVAQGKHTERLDDHERRLTEGGL